MRFTPQFLDDLRARLPVSEVVSKRVKLKKAGREWKGLSPFQQEKSPSFTVNDQKGFYHDFSCWNGDSPLYSRPAFFNLTRRPTTSETGSRARSSSRN